MRQDTALGNANSTTFRLAMNKEDSSFEEEGFHIGRFKKKQQSK